MEKNDVKKALGSLITLLDKLTDDKDIINRRYIMNKFKNLNIKKFDQKNGNDYGYFNQVGMEIGITNSEYIIFHELIHFISWCYQEKHKKNNPKFLCYKPDTLNNGLNEFFTNYIVNYILNVDEMYIHDFDLKATKLIGDKIGIKAVIRAVIKKDLGEITKPLTLKAPVDYVNLVISSLSNFYDAFNKLLIASCEVDTQLNNKINDAVKTFFLAYNYGFKKPHPTVYTIENINIWNDQWLLKGYFNSIEGKTNINTFVVDFLRFIYGKDIFNGNLNPSFIKQFDYMGEIDDIQTILSAINNLMTNYQSYKKIPKAWLTERTLKDLRGAIESLIEYLPCEYYDNNSEISEEEFKNFVINYLNSDGLAPIRSFYPEIVDYFLIRCEQTKYDVLEYKKMSK